jgi:hypothetical protein
MNSTLPKARAQRSEVPKRNAFCFLSLRAALCAPACGSAEGKITPSGTDLTPGFRRGADLQCRASGADKNLAIRRGVFLKWEIK